MALTKSGRRGNPYHDKLGKFATAGATAGGGDNPNPAPAPAPASADLGADVLGPGTVAEGASPAEVAKAQAELDKAGFGIAETKTPVVVGENVTLYHRTTPERAAAIEREGFRADAPKNTPGMSAVEKQSAFFVHPGLVENWRGYGEAVVSVTVPRAAVHVDTTMPSVPPPLRVSVSDLAKARVSRVK